MITYKRRRRGRGFLNKVINKLPFELHLPGYQYCGPGTKLRKRLARGDSGVNPLDAACKEHDIAYSKNRESIEARNTADRVLAEKAWQRVQAGDANFGEKTAAYAVTNAMKLKSKLGMGMRRRNRRPITLSNVLKVASQSLVPRQSIRERIHSSLKGARKAVREAGGKVSLPRVLPVPSKVGGFLPLLFAGLSAAGALAGGAAGIAKAVKDAKAANKLFEESQRHNRRMEEIALGEGLYLKPHKTGLGLYLKPHKTGRGLDCSKKKKILEVRLPQRALTDFDLLKYARILKIPHFRGVFMRNALPDTGPHYRESAIVNLDDKDGPGTHWVAYRKRGSNVVYFDSFGDLQPPQDLMAYLGVDEVKYNHERYQDFDTFNCGHLCLKFLQRYIRK